MSDDFNPDEDLTMPFVDYRRSRHSVRRPIVGPRGMRKPYWLDAQTPPPKTNLPKVDVLVSFGYDLYGDIDTDAWTDRFDKAETGGWITNYSLLLVQTGSFGLRHLTMTVEADVPAGPKEQIDHDVFLLLAAIIGATDVQVHFVSPA